MAMHRTLLLIAALAAALVACSPDKGFKSEQVGRTDYGEAWPLTVEDALLVCDPGGVPTVQSMAGLMGSGTSQLPRRPRGVCGGSG